VRGRTARFFSAFFLFRGALIDEGKIQVSMTLPIISVKRRKTMKDTILKTLGFALLTLAIFGPAGASAQELASADQSTSTPALRKGTGARAVEGAWNVRMSPVNCETGVPLLTFDKLLTFMQGGTLQEDSVGSAPLPRSSGHGAWQYEGEQTFSYTNQFFRFNLDGTYNSRTVARFQIVMQSENSYTGTAQIRVYNPAGAPIANLCAVETGTRFE
jgi:hypothetical protein